MIGQRKNTISSVLQYRYALTLIELLIVVVFIAVLVGGVTVSFQGRRDVHALDIAAKDLAAAIRYAILQSQLRQCEYRLVFCDDFRSYRVEKILSGGQETLPVTGRAGLARPFPDNVHIVGVKSVDDGIEDLPNMLVFCGGQGGFNGFIQLSNSQDQTISIEVTANTGQVHIVK